MAQERISLLEESIRDPLPRLKEQLIEEFEGQREDLIDQAAKHSLNRYKSAKVRECVQIVADTPEGTSATSPNASCSRCRRRRVNRSSREQTSFRA